jgi:hypothetical protein
MTTRDTTALLQHLGRELWQTETSAFRHCAREAHRLHDTPPGAAQRAVSSDAERVLVELREVARREGLVVSGFGIAIGGVLSELRDTLLDKLIVKERSYRVTLLGMRHGVDVVSALAQVAERAGRNELVAFCRSWHERRVPLVAAVEAELKWFAVHPDVALRRARSVV